MHKNTLFDHLKSATFAEVEQMCHNDYFYDDDGAGGDLLCISSEDSQGQPIFITFAKTSQGLDCCVVGSVNYQSDLNSVADICFAIDDLRNHGLKI